jgi:spermidine/putrescine-binding protein
MAKDVLRVLAWPGYADPDVVHDFERRYQVSVEVTFVDSDEALWAHMHAPGHALMWLPPIPPKCSATMPPACCCR